MFFTLSPESVEPFLSNSLDVAQAPLSDPNDFDCDESRSAITEPTPKA
jgi:hypothetical protein